jgi:hypothetical protein
VGRRVLACVSICLENNFCFTVIFNQYLLISGHRYGGDCRSLSPATQNYPTNLEIKNNHHLHNYYTSYKVSTNAPIHDPSDQAK